MRHGDSDTKVGLSFCHHLLIGLTN